MKALLSGIPDGRFREDDHLDGSSQCSDWSPRKPSGPADNGVRHCRSGWLSGVYTPKAVTIGEIADPIIGRWSWIPDSLAAQGFRDDRA